MPDAYDYVVVGAGSAGCVIASRLSEDASRSVLLLEAGPKDRNPLIRFPLGEAFTVGGSIDWKLETVAEPGLGGRKMAQPRGRVLGGSSSINGQMYVRGHASDYDDWDANGCTGWSYGGVLPYFRRSENWKSSEDQFRGADGPLSVAPGRYRSPTCRRFLEAASEAGYPLNDDYNGSQQDGFGWLQYTHTHAFPFRCSTAHAYLKPARARPNLTVRTGAQATALTFDGRRCMGVTYSQNGRSVTVRAGREVILSAGAYHTPHLLLLSGVGPADDLVAQGISVVADMPGVGKNLQDHAGAFIQHKADVSDSYHKLLGPIGGVSACARLFLQRTGPLTVFPLNVTGFVRSDASLERPDIQYYFGPVTSNPKTDSFFPAFPGYKLTWCVLRPSAQGSVKLASRDPQHPPKIEHGYLSTAADVAANRAAFRIGRNLLTQPAMRALAGYEDLPGDGVESDDEIDGYVRDHLGTHYHPVGTCRMGGDAGAVVDPRLRVAGIDGLRIVDASVMPNIVGGNTNAPTIMIAEKAADLIREDDR